MEILDGAMPAANGVAATALLRLGALRGDGELTAAGESLLATLCPVALEHPLACANTVAACELAGGGITEVVITGERPDLLAAATSPLRTDHGPGLGRAHGVTAVGGRATTGSDTCAGTSSARCPPRARPSSGSGSTRSATAGRAPAGARARP